jgi:SET domain-containing protein
MKSLLGSDKVYIGKSHIPKAGRGVFTRRDIKKGEIIETCPLIEINKHDMASLSESILVTYFFFFGRKKDRLAIALGYGSIYNHSGKPNAVFKINPTENMMDFTALRKIKKGEEITFDYYNSSNPKHKKNPLWFEVN